MFAPDQIDAVAAEADLSPAKIYMFASRPRVIIHDPEDEGRVAVVGPVAEPHLRIPLGSFKVSSSAGGQRVRLENQGGETVFEGRPSMLMQTLFLHHDDWDESVLGAMRDWLDLDVLYVGKSDDEGGALGGRLQSHATFQRILAEYSENHPDREIWLLVFVFDVTNTVGVLTGGSSESDASIESRIAAERPQLSWPQVTSLAEGALIRYFGPPFNKQLKTSFPSRGHKTYLEALAYDYNSYGFVLQSADLLGVWLGSETVTKAPWHEQSFPIDAKKHRLPLTMQSILESNRHRE